MEVNELVITGKKFRKLTDTVHKQWQRISFWHKASDCEFDDGKTAETKVGAINGITSDFTCENESIAASMVAVSQLFQSASEGKKLLAATLTGLGVSTAADATFSQIKTNISTLNTNRYNAGYNAGYNTGRIQGQNDVKNNPAAYGISVGTPNGTVVGITVQMFANGEVGRGTTAGWRFTLQNGALVGAQENSVSITAGGVGVICRQI